MGQPIRVAIIGAGAVTSTIHLPIVTRRRDHFIIAGLYDLNADAVNALGERFAIPQSARFTDVDAMLAQPNVDAVLILNSGTHAEFVVKALNAGKHVMCEKPLAYTKREIEQIRKAQAATGKHVMVGYMKTHDPAVRRAAELLKTDGPVHSVDVLVLHPSGDSQLATSEISVDRPDTPAEHIKLFTKMRQEVQREALGELADQIGDLYSEIIMGSLIHELSVLRALGVSIEGIDYVDRWPTDKSTSLIIQAHGKNGTRISMRWFYLDRFPEYQEEVRWISETASHHLLFPSPYFLRTPTRLNSMRSHGETKENLLSTNYYDGFEVELADFYESVTTGKQLGSTVDDAEKDLLTCQRIAKFIAENESLKFSGDLESVN